jgi:hypothetical protein
VNDYRCVPPTLVGESDNNSTWCGGDRHPGTLPACASHRRGRVQERLIKVWRWSAPTPRPSTDDCRCVPPTTTGESENSPAWCGGDRHHPPSKQTTAGARLPPSRVSPITAPHGVAVAGTPPLRQARLLVSACTSIHRGWVNRSTGKGTG